MSAQAKTYNYAMTTTETPTFLYLQGFPGKRGNVGLNKPTGGCWRFPGQTSILHRVVEICVRRVGKLLPHGFV